MNIGIFGYGQFARLMVQYLAPHATVRAYSRRGGTDACLASIEEVCASDILIFSVPSQSFDDACLAAAPFITPSTLIADVTSVKVKPLEALVRHFPSHAILGTHPIFGPQSAKDGVAGFPIVMCNVSWESQDYANAKKFLSDTLKLRVIERTPEEHDREMAEIMALSHFIGRALARMEIREHETGTFSYHQLVELRDLLQHDSWELFKTIQNENPYSEAVRTRFVGEINALETELRGDT